MKIAHLSVVHRVYDTRIYHKECKSLSKVGHEVFLVIPHDKEEISEGVNIIPLKQFKKTIYRTYLNLPLVLLKSIKLNANVYHLHDPELIPLGIILKLFKKRIIYDVHEDYKEMPKRKFFRILFGIYEKFAIKIFDKFIAATPKIGEKFPKDKTITLCNYPILSLIDENIKNSNKINSGNKAVLIYEGGLTRKMGIKEVIKSLEYLDKDVELRLMGKWEEGYKEECEKLDGWAKTNYLGLRSLEEVFSYIYNSDIGFCVLYKIPNHLMGLPVKVFEYMAFSIPTVMSDLPYWKEMYTECALFVNPYDPKDIAEKIHALLENKELRIRLGKRGRALVEAKYNWETESKKLIKLYSEL